MKTTLAKKIDAKESGEELYGQRIKALLLLSIDKMSVTSFTIIDIIHYIVENKECTRLTAIQKSIQR